MSEGMVIGMSNFAKVRHVPGGGYSYFMGTERELEAIIACSWGKRELGFGCDDIDKVCVVTVPADRFFCPLIRVEDAKNLKAEVVSRREGEEKHVEVRAEGPHQQAKFCKVVLYSAQALIDEGEERSGDYDWEIISIMASPVEKEPMNPLTMARNQLGKEGGSARTYSPEEWAEAVWYWSQYVLSV